MKLRYKVGMMIFTPLDVLESLRDNSDVATFGSIYEQSFHHSTTLVMATTLFIERKAMFQCLRAISGAEGVEGSSVMLKEVKTIDKTQINNMTRKNIKSSILYLTLQKGIRIPSR